MVLVACARIIWVIDLRGDQTYNYLVYDIGIHKYLDININILSNDRTNKIKTHAFGKKVIWGEASTCQTHWTAGWV